MKKILILTHEKDGTANMVIEKLNEKGGKYIRFNTDEFPEKAGVTVKWLNDVMRGHLVINNQTVNLDEIEVIWNRRPHQPIISVFSDLVAKDWAEKESFYALQCLWSLIRDRFWVNPILECEKIQFNKWLQLVVAHKVGLKTPPSLLSNIPIDIITFHHEIKTDLALKSIKSVAVHYDEKTLLLHTKRLEEKDLNKESLKNISYSPVFLQKYIDKKLELRITVVDKKVFTCGIDSQINKQTLDDWRKHIFLKDELPHKVYKLPAEIEQKCIDLVRELGLYFGAIDMILTPKDEYVFLELNPNGQWGWIEQLTNMPISSAIADLLIKGNPD